MAQLAKVGIVAKTQNVEWAQWLSGTYGNKNYDLTLIRHVEPFDLGNFAKPDYYWGYQSAEVQRPVQPDQERRAPQDRARLLGDAQKLLADDAVHAFLYQPQWITVANKNLKGLWKDMPGVRERPLGPVLRSPGGGVCPCCLHGGKITLKWYSGAALLSISARPFHEQLRLQP